MHADKPGNTARDELILQKTPIAVIGLAGLFPDSKDINQYWDNIINEVDTIKDVPPSRWKIEDYYDPDPGAADKTYSKRGGFIPDIDFNPMEFGLPPNILEVTDVSQLLALVVARQVLEDAGYGTKSNYNRENIGITLGVGGGQKLITPLTTRLQYPIWKQVLTNSGVTETDADEIVAKIKKAYVGWEENSFPGMLGNVIAGRVANRLNLGGTNCVLDAACASSLTAIKMAVSDLLEYRSEIMIAGGIDTDNSPFMYLSFSKTPAFTPDDTSRPFDIDSNGMLIGEGLGMVALKRLEDARRDQDRIYAVIKGIGTSSDGRYKSIYAPRPEGQVKALQQAYFKAGFPPQSVGLVEAHGTGTAAGDMAEFSALKTVFTADDHPHQHIALGSVKSQIGHTKAAAGSAGFIKAALALYHRVLPATINVKEPQPKIEIESSPFYINSETRPWFPAPQGTPRRAAVSAFGFGGTNFHVALEEYAPRTDANQNRNGYRPRKHSTLHPVVISGPTPDALLEKVKGLHADLTAENNDQAFYELVRGNGISKRPASHARLGFLCGDHTEAVKLADLAIKGLTARRGEAWESPEGLFYRPAGLDTRGHVVALFPGQGSQYLDMGSRLAMNFPAVMDSFTRMNRLFAEAGRPHLTATVFPIPVFTKKQKKANTQALQQTEIAQPAIGALSVGMYTLFKAAGFRPDFTAGHSFGELTALHAAGVFSADDFCFLARERGRAMAAPDDQNFDAGAMLAVVGDIDNLRTDLQAMPDIVIANFNSGRQAVVAGPQPAIKAARQDLKARGYSVIPLPVSAAFHTPLVDHARRPFARALETVKFKRPEIPVYTNTLATPYPADPEKIRDILKDHILNPVRFKDEIDNIYQAGGRIFIEFGPKNVLTRLVGSILADRPHTAIALNTGRDSSDVEMRQAALKMCVAGLEIEDIDPHEKILPEPPGKSAGRMQIALNGSNYVSAKTRTIFEDALNDGFTIQQSTPASSSATTPAPAVIQSESTPPAVDHPVPPQARITHPPISFEKGETPMKRADQNPGPIDTGKGSMENIENNIEQFFKHQDETLKVHSQYLSGIKEYTGLFYDLMKQQHALLREQPGLELPAGIERSMDLFHTHQGDTLKVHGQYLDNQTVCVREALGLIKQKVTGQPVDNLVRGASRVSAPGPVSTPESIQSTRATHNNPPPEIAPEVTGPSEPEPVSIEPEPVMEASSTLPPAPDALSENASIPLAPSAPAAAPAPQPPDTVLAADLESLKTAMLAVVSEKTGYPAEMLELDMDMEADLGIDSIKRVEILAGFTEQFPDLPEANPDELAELKTLGEVIDKYRRLAPPAAGAPAAPGTPEATSTPDPIQTLTRVMLEVVAEKTGYPAEMLELDMDMEADLGIDSIKRVEILAGFTEQFPDLPEANPDELAELKTLQEVIDKYRRLAQPAAAEPPASDPRTAASHQPDMETLTRVMLEVVADKTGYPAEMLELDMDMEADLGIDSIKRVEILAGVQERFPQLPEVDADQLAGLKTLGEVTVCMAAAGPQPATAAPEDQTAPQEITAGARRSVGQIRKLPAPDTLVSGLPPDAVCLVTDDGTRVTAMLAEKLSRQGLRVVVISYPESVVKRKPKLASGIVRLTVADMREESLQGLIDTILQQFGKIDGFIHLHPPALKKSRETLVFPEKEMAMLLWVFLAAKHLKPHLAADTASGRRFFMTACRLDGQLGLSGRGFGLVSGGLCGLTKTLNLEWDSVFARIVDLGPDRPPAESAAIIASELFDPDRRIVETAYGPEGRITLAALEAEGAYEVRHNRIDDAAVFLVAGGAKGVTARCAIALASAHKCRFILMGRSPYQAVPDPDWAAGLKDAAELKKAIMLQLKQAGEPPTPKAVENMYRALVSQRDISRTLADIRATGSLAEYICADVTDQKSIQDQLAPVVDKLGPVTGLIHGAGVLADRHIEDKTVADFMAVYTTKVKGLAILLDCVETDRLTHLALFSSAAGFFGNAGQADYAIANEILNKSAFRFKALNPACHVNTFNWGPWDGGMVTPELKRMFADKHIAVIPMEAGSRLFANELSAADTTTQIMVGSSMRARPQPGSSELGAYRITRRLVPEDNPFLQDHMIGPNPVLPTVCAGAWMAEACEMLYPGFQFFTATGYRMFKGIVFDGTQAQHYTLDIEEVVKDEDHINFNVTISSRKKNGKPLHHYTSGIELVSRIPEPPLYSRVDFEPAGALEGGQLYRNGTLFHGPIFQGIERVINLGEHGLTVECRLPEVAHRDQGQFTIGTFNPYAADIQFQCMLVWVRRQLEAASLPAQAQTAEHYLSVPAGRKFYVSLSVKASSSASVTADITTHDREGRIYSRIAGATVIVSKQLDRLFSKTG